ncbi:MAG: N-acetyltransferase [Candidatus Omnitrophica bacterium]|nr:N-acetyltransferase [Candidatus Omnitrophota bacterium]
MKSKSRAKNGIFVHPSAFVDKPSLVGEGTQIWHFSHIMKGSKIGKNCKLGQNVVVHGTAVIGNNVKIQNNVSVYDAVTLEDYVFCGPSCVFTNIINPRSAIPRNADRFYKRTLIKKGATIGANATIVCGVTIGNFAFIGAGAVVTKDIPDYALAYGNPARAKGWVCECGDKINFSKGKALCQACKKKYRLSKGFVTAA